MRRDGIDARAIVAKRTTNSLRPLLIYREKTRIRVYERAQWRNSDGLSRDGTIMHGMTRPISQTELRVSRCNERARAR